MKRFLMLCLFVFNASASDRVVIFECEDEEDGFWNELCKYQHEYREKHYANPAIVAKMDKITNEINEAIGQDSVAIHGFSLFRKPDIRVFIDYTLDNLNNISQDNYSKFKEILYIAAPMSWADTRVNRIIDLIPNRDRYSIRREDLQYREFCTQMYRLRAIEQARIGNLELANASEFAVDVICNDVKVSNGMIYDMYNGDIIEDMDDMAYGPFLENIFPNFMDWRKLY
jgi:hypothetical protein